MSPSITHRVLIKNVVANVASGTSAAMLAVVLPPILLKFLSKDVYAVWALVLQMGAYVGLLNFGIQTAVGRYVAHYETRGEVEKRNALVSTAWVGLLAAGVFACLCMIGVSIFLPRLFPNIPSSLHGQARVAMAWIGLSSAVSLPFTVFMGVFVGRQRNEVPGVIQVASRLFAGVVLVWITSKHGTLASMAVAYGCVNITTCAIQYGAYRLFDKSTVIRPSHATKTAAKDLWEYCLSLSVWNIAMLMISGLDLVIVGRVDFAAVPAYAIVTGVVAFVAGLQNAVFNVLIPASAILGAKDDSSRLQQMFLDATRYGVVLLLVSSIPLLLGGGILLRRYMDPALASTALPLLWFLLVGNFIRLTATPYASLLIGTGQQRIVLITPIVEGVVNVVLSILLGMRIGAKGVAIGTIVGALIGVVCNMFYNFPRTKLLVVDLRLYLFQGLLVPLSIGIPVVGVYFVAASLNVSDLIRWSLVACSVVCSGVLAFNLLSARWEFTFARKRGDGA